MKIDVRPMRFLYENRPMRFLYDKVMRPEGEEVGVFSACKGHEVHACSI